MRYITVPIEVNPETLFSNAVAYLQTKFPNWQPRDGNLDTAMLEATVIEGADCRTLASKVPDTIFRTLGSSLFNLPPNDAIAATVATTWTVKDTAGYTIQAGRQVGIRNASGVLVPFTVLNDVVILGGSSATSAGQVICVAVSPGTLANGLGSPGGNVELLDPLEWVVGITQVAASSGGTEDELDDDYLSRLATEIQIMSPTPIKPGDFSILARKVPGVYRAVTVDLLNPYGNLLTANQSSIETSAAGWTNKTNVVVAQSAVQFSHGTKSLSMTSVAGGTMQAITATQVPVVAGKQYTVGAELRAATVARSCAVHIQWWTAAMVSLGTSTGLNASDNTTGWVQRTLTTTAPVTAAFADVIVQVLSTGGASEVHYVDKAFFRYGKETVWTLGPIASENVEKMVTVFAQDSTGVKVSAGVRTAIEVYLAALRETNFVVNTSDVVSNPIDITYNISIFPGYVGASVITAVNLALTNFLNPTVWGIVGTDPLSWVNETVVRYLEVASVINAVPGVNIVNSLTLGPHSGALSAADLPMDGIVPLPVASTLSGTVT